MVRAARLLQLAGEEARATQFLRHAAAGMAPPERAALAQMARNIPLGRLGTPEDVAQPPPGRVR